MFGLPREYFVVGRVVLGPLCRKCRWSSLHVAPAGELGKVSDQHPTLTRPQKHPSFQTPLKTPLLFHSFPPRLCQGLREGAGWTRLRALKTNARPPKNDPSGEATGNRTRETPKPEGQESRVQTRGVTCWVQPTSQESVLC